MQLRGALLPRKHELARDSNNEILSSRKRKRGCYYIMCVCDVCFYSKLPKNKINLTSAGRRPPPRSASSRRNRRSNWWFIDMDAVQFGRFHSIFCMNCVLIGVPSLLLYTLACSLFTQPWPVWMNVMVASSPFGVVVLYLIRNPWRPQSRTTTEMR